MSKVKKNLLTQGLSGMIGGMLVFRRVGNDTIVTGAPSKGRDATPVQNGQRFRFRQAVNYGKAQMADPQRKQAYVLAVKNRPSVSAYNAAVSDFLVPPQITEINLTGYTGKASDIIRIRAYDDVKVTGVSVSITDPSGIVLESGQAVFSGFDWVYPATTSQPGITGDFVTVSATDMAGNETVQTREI